MIFEILTLFPRMFDGVFADSILRRAVDKGLISIRVQDIRPYSADERHGSVDDYPYGGGAGMLMKAQPLADAIRASRARLKGVKPVVALLSPTGTVFDHAMAQELAREQALVLVCGRYKGVDERVAQTCVDREISVGDYVLSGGEIPAMAMVDALTRLIPGVLGDRESAEKDSLYDGLLEPPQYTRPEVFEGASVPEVLLSGNHERIRKWQAEQAQERTRARRPDLWERYTKNGNQPNT
jgi:tRNA (guanine37-N1)-methyltransferase